MKISKYFSVMMLLLFALIAFSGCKKAEAPKDLLQTVRERGKILAGVKYDSKPFGFIDQDSTLKGFDVDLAREIAQRVLGNKDAVDFQQVTSSNRIFSLTSGSLDMVAATMTINPKRELIIDFSIPYFIAGQAIMIPENSKIKTVRDLNGKRVIVVIGSTSERNIRELAPTAIVTGFRTYTDAFSALKSGRGDVLTTDDTIIAGFLSEVKGFKMLKERYTQEPYGIGFRKDDSTKSFQRAVNMAIDDIKADGTLDRLTKKWMTDYANKK